MVRTQTHKNNKDNCNKKNKTVSHLQPFLNRRLRPFFTVLILTFSPCKEGVDNRRLQPLFPNVLATFASAFAFEDKNNNNRNNEKKTKKKNEKTVVPPRDGVKTNILACFPVHICIVPTLFS